MDAATGGAVPVLHVVTDDRVLSAPSFVPVAQRLLERGGPALALHVRGPGTPGRVLLERVRALAGAASASGSLLVVNDRVDVALVCRAGGVQLGERSFPLGEARDILGGTTRVGLSVHDPEGAAAGEAGGADWCLVGTVYATPSHPAREGGGASLVERAGLAAPRTPLVAIGGVTPERVAELLTAGAWGVAVIRGIWDASAPEAALEAYMSGLAVHRGPQREGP